MRSKLEIGGALKDNGQPMAYVRLANSPLRGRPQTTSARPARPPLTPVGGMWSTLLLGTLLT
eukprot:8169656-Lingulodinium_polyedra.AAC.1